MCFDYTTPPPFSGSKMCSPPPFWQLKKCPPPPPDLLATDDTIAEIIEKLIKAI